MRTAQIERNTAETKISLSLTLEGTGKSQVKTGCGFLDHMLTLFAAHGGFDLSLTCEGDTWVDDHHTAEDVGICLGKAFSQAVGDKRGIARYGNCILPMDEALILTAVDVSGRSCLCSALTFPTEKIGSFDTQSVQEFFLGFVRNFPISLHIRQLAGENSHHIAEGAFKSLARSLSAALVVQGDKIPSTKGVLE